MNYVMVVHGEESEVDEQQTAANADSNSATSQQNPDHPTDTAHSGPDAGGETTESPTLMQTMTKLLQAQTQAMAAQALATAVNHLPPLPLYTGEKE